MRFNINKYRGGQYRMHCKTIEEAETFLIYLNELGKCWCNGDAYVEQTHYEDYGDKTVYYFNTGKYGNIDKALTPMYVIEFDMFDWSGLDLTPPTSRDAAKIDSFLSQFVTSL